MNRFEFDDIDEEYYFDTIEEFQSERYFVLVIYDVVDNKKRLNICLVMELECRSLLLR